MREGERPVVFYDGKCGFCHFWVLWILHRDREGVFQFASLESAYARKRWKREGVTMETLILIENGRVYFRSTAILRICKRLSGFWRVLYGFILIPRSIRDWLYDWIAQNRYKLGGELMACWIPKPEWKERFLD